MFWKTVLISDLGSRDGRLLSVRKKSKGKKRKNFRRVVSLLLAENSHLLLGDHGSLCLTMTAQTGSLLFNHARAKVANFD